jgi:hypothetical protein
MRNDDLFMADPSRLRPNGGCRNGSSAAGLASIRCGGATGAKAMGDRLGAVPQFRRRGIGPAIVPAPERSGPVAV